MPDGQTPQAFFPLPGHTGNTRPVFKRCLTDLIELTGADTPDPSLDDRQWVGRARQLLRAVFRQRLANPEWFGPLMRAAIYDPDPSHCRIFVEPALAAYGHRRVQEALIRVLEEGSDPEIAGAARAWYCAHLRLRESGSNYSAAPATPVVDDDASGHRRKVWQETALRIFVANGDLDVRCCILPLLCLNTAYHRPELHGLVDRAVSIARNSSNEYLRHRVEVQVAVGT